jgi:hypothetical protein
MVGPLSASRESVCASCTASRGRRRAARLVLCPRRIIARSRACRLRRRWLCRARTTAGGPSSPQRWAVGGASRRPRGRVEQGSLTPRARPLEGRRRPRRRDFRPPGAAARGRAPAAQPGGLGLSRLPPAWHSHGVRAFHQARPPLRGNSPPPVACVNACVSAHNFFCFLHGCITARALRRAISRARRRRAPPTPRLKHMAARGAAALLAQPAAKYPLAAWNKPAVYGLRGGSISVRDNACVR